MNGMDKKINKIFKRKLFKGILTISELTPPEFKNIKNSDNSFFKTL